MGRYVYATLRGQQRIEEMARPRVSHPRGAITKDSFLCGITGSGIAWTERELQALWRQSKAQSPHIPRGGKDPAVTHRHLYKGAELFVHTEDKRKRSGMDQSARTRNREDDCHSVARCFIAYSGLDPILTDVTFSELPNYEALAEHVRKHPLPLLVELAIRDPLVAQNRQVQEDTLFETHSFIVLGFSEGDFICLEKVGDALPWRLSSMKETYEMYERDFRAANQGRPRLFWTISTLPKLL